MLLRKAAQEAKIFKQHMDYDKTKPSFAKASAGEAGQTLVALLFFVMVGMIVTTAAVMILSTNSLAAQKLSQGEVTRQLAESGAENALLRLLRDKSYGDCPNYCTGDTLNIGDDSVLIRVTTTTIAGTTTITIDSVATSGNFVRKVEVVAKSNDVLTPVSWKEI